jgi:hypothetical protein
VRERPIPLAALGADDAELDEQVRKTMAAVMRGPIELWGRILGGVTLHLVEHREAK